MNRNVVFFPKEKKDDFTTYNTFVIQVDKRDKLKKFLDKKKENYDNTEYQAKRIISLPINQFLKKKEILFICKTINNFFN